MLCCAVLSVCTPRNVQCCWVAALTCFIQKRVLRVPKHLLIRRPGFAGLATRSESPHRPAVNDQPMAAAGQRQRQPTASMVETSTRTVCLWGCSRAGQIHGRWQPITPPGRASARPGEIPIYPCACPEMSLSRPMAAGSNACPAICPAMPARQALRPPPPPAWKLQLHALPPPTSLSDAPCLECLLVPFPCSSTTHGGRFGFGPKGRPPRGGL